MSGASAYHRETFSPAERGILERFVTDVDGPVFALTNLPEVVKGALFSRYSRTTKSIRRLFLDEFYDVPEIGIAAVAEAMGKADEGVNRERAERLYQRVFTEYGDDSVAQLGGVHLACEQASNLLTKVLEWGRIASYLEQSTRYIFYDQRLGERYRYHVPPEVAGTALEAEFRTTLDWLFDTYASLIDDVVAYFEAAHPQQPGDSDVVYRATIRAAACDDLRGLLPAATTSNVGIYASGQAYEMMLLRMRAYPLAEIRAYADLMLIELRKVIPAFLRRVDLPDRGGAWSAYIAETAAAAAEAAAAVPVEPASGTEVELTDWDPDGELKVAAAALYAGGNLSDAQALAHVRGLTPDARAAILRRAVGDRRNRRHKPGRAFERTSYRFDVLADYGIFRDLQRHRMLTLEWQRLGPRHGYITPEVIHEIGATGLWDEAMERTAGLHAAFDAEFGPDVAQYTIPFAYRVRFYMEFNAREAFHLLELRTVRGGHESYRRICQQMHDLIGEGAGHRVIAAAMEFVDHEDYGLARLEGERRAERRRSGG